MLDSFSTNAVTAKIRAIHAKMFNGDNYRELMARRTVAEAAEYLAHSPRYREVFAEVDPSAVHRGYVEELLYKENYNCFQRLCRFEGLDKQPFYELMIRRGDIDCILSAINCLNSFGGESAGEEYLKSIPAYAVPDMDQRLLKIGTVGSFQELVDALRGTRFYKLLAKVPLREDGLADYTECELRLRNDYYKRLLEGAETFGGATADELRKLILQEIDHRNIVNAYRMKKYFGYSTGEMIAGSLKFTAIGKKTMFEIMGCETAEEMLELVDRTVYGRGSPKTDNIEIKLNSVRFRRLCSALYSSTAAPLSMYVFLQMCEIDASNIVHIIEGIRYGAEPSVIESLLITL